jgi:uncharacterized protein
MLTSLRAPGERGSLRKEHSMHTWMRRQAASVALLTALALLATACDTRITTTSTPSEQTGIAVTGTGKVTVVPDVGLIFLGVEVSRPTVAAAREGASKAMDAVRASLKQNGVADKDIATQGFSIQPQYDFPTPSGPATRPQISGYTATNQVSVKVRQMDALTKVLDGAVTAGGDDVRVNNVSFVVDEPEKHVDRAREQAVADARAHAETLARASGVKLGKVRSIIEGGGGQPFPYPVAAMPPMSGGFGGKGGDSPVSPGETELSILVSVTFDIE